MYKACKTQQSAKRQQYIVDCLLRMWCRQSYDSITVSALCQDAGVPRKTFYRYFESKDDVFSFALDSLIIKYESFAGPYAPNEPHTPEKDMEKLFSFYQTHDFILELMLRDNMTGVVIERTAKYIWEQEAAAQLRYTSESSMFRQMAVLFSTCGLFALILDWYKKGYPCTAREMALVARQLLTNPMFEPLS